LIDIQFISYNFALGKYTFVYWNFSEIMMWFSLNPDIFKAKSSNDAEYRLKIWVRIDTSIDIDTATTNV
jgi:hypothetical protein